MHAAQRARSVGPTGADIYAAPVILQGHENAPQDGRTTCCSGGGARSNERDRGHKGHRQPLQAKADCHKHDKKRAASLEHLQQAHFKIEVGHVAKGKCGCRAEAQRHDALQVVSLANHLHMQEQELHWLCVHCGVASMVDTSMLAGSAMLL